MGNSSFDVTGYPRVMLLKKEAKFKNTDEIRSQTENSLLFLTLSLYHSQPIKF